MDENRADMCKSGQKRAGQHAEDGNNISVCLGRELLWPGSCCIILKNLNPGYTQTEPEQVCYLKDTTGVEMQ